MRRAIIFLSAFFAAVCVILAVMSPDYLSMMIVGVMTVAIFFGFAFSLIPSMRFGQGFRSGMRSIDRTFEINADYVWTAVENVLPFFRQKQLDEMFENYLRNVREQKEKGVIISDIEDIINEESLSIYCWRGVVLQIAGVLTALGLLGTFLGLVTGISTVEFSSAEATMDSISTPRSSALFCRFCSILRTGWCGISCSARCICSWNSSIPISSPLRRNSFAQSNT